MDLRTIKNKNQVLDFKNKQDNPDIFTGNSVHNCSLSNKADKDAKTTEQERYDHVLGQLKKERLDESFSRDCLFCRKHFTGNRSILLNHLSEQHHFFIGDPNNIVFVNEFLDYLEQMLKDLRCFYCERVFKSWMALKEHMRKKQHKRINPLNQSVDRFYVVNYLESGKTWRDIAKEDDRYSEDDSGKELIGWGDCSITFVCLFCEEGTFDGKDVLQHMKEVHKFDFKELGEKHHLSFYQQIRIVNYIRKKVHEKECLWCDARFDFSEDLRAHLLSAGHTSALPDPSLWDQPIFYFPTFENDDLLWILQDESSDCEVSVYPEDPRPAFTPSATDSCQ